MPVKYRKNCKVCVAIDANKTLMNQLYETRAFRPGGESVLHFSERTGLHYKSLNNHLKNHQFIDDNDLTTRQMARLHEVKSQKIISTLTSTVTARQDVLDLLYAKIMQHGDITIGKDISLKDAMSLLLTASKNTDDVNAKKGDQAIDVMKQLQGVRAGGQEPDEPTEGEVA